MTRWTLALTLLLAALLAASPPPASAEAPAMLSYQGRLLDSSGNPVSGELNVTFRIYEIEASTTALWSETRTVSFGPDGLFWVALGGATAGIDLPFDQGYWLGIQVEGDAEMLPRVPLLSSPYSLHSQSVADGAIDSASVAPGTVVRSLNGLRDDLQIAAGSNVTVSESGDTITISASGGSSGDSDWVVSGDDLYSGVSGNVGIGTSSPSRKLHLQTPTSVAVDLGLRSGGSWTALLEQSPESLFSIANGGSQRLFIPANGRVGVGTSSPTAQLEVAGGDDPQVVIDSTDDLGDDAGLVIRGSRNGSTTADVAYVDLQDYDADELVGVVFSMARVVGGLDATSGRLGNLRLQTNDGSGLVERMRIDSQGNVGIGTASPTARLEVAGGTLINGANGGRLDLENASGLSTVALDGDDGGGSGRMDVYDDSGFRTVEIDGEQSAAGNVNLYSNVGVKTIEIDAREGDGAGEIILYDASGAQTIEIDGDKGGTSRITVDVVEITGGADLSEPFDILEEGGAIEPGSVVSIDPASPGDLRLSGKAYDRRVAGIVSGAGGVRPGMIMGQRGSRANGQSPVALTGRVYCKVDASYGPVGPGDLLTTSDTPGHAMVVRDHGRAAGAILGKAMGSLAAGRGEVLVLVSLQ